MTNTTETSAHWTRPGEAAAYAFVIHAGQRRKGTAIPYVAHLMSVAALVLEHGGDEDQAIAGFPHDAIEDVGAEQDGIINDRLVSDAGITTIQSASHRAGQRHV